MSGNDKFLGTVQFGHFQILTPDHAAGDSVRLTGIQMQEARPPESRELDLTEYEGQAIMVRGHYGGDWMFSAEVIDQAGPILTAVVTHVFSQSGEAS